MLIIIFQLTITVTSVHIQHIKSLEKSKKGKIKIFTKQNIKISRKKYPVQVAVTW
jgi:hypothetical protein